MAGSAGAVLVQLLSGVAVEPVVVGPDQVALAPVLRDNGVARAPAWLTSRADSTATQLDRIVVMGSATGASAHRLTIGVDVVEGRRLEERGVTSLAEALDGLVPGVWVWEQSPSSPIAHFASLRGASSFGASQPKVYLDGVQMANPLLLSQLTPQTIDRIEVIRGPQSAALYGADAIGGVVNIVSRYDGANQGGGRVTWRSSVGQAASEFAAGGVATQRHALSLAAGPSTRTISAAVDFASMGAFVPESRSRQLVGALTSRWVGARSTLLASAHAAGQRAGPSANPLVDSIIALGRTPPEDGPASERHESQVARQYTVALTGTRLHNDRWTSTATIGADGYALENASMESGPVPSVADSALRAANGGADRLTARASAVAQVARGVGVAGTLTMGVEHTTLRERLLTAGPTPGFGFAPHSEEAVSTRHSTGVLGQVAVAVRDRWFLTSGLRLERTAGNAATSETMAMPMLGGAWVGRWPRATLKVHVAFGRGVRPPRAPQQLSMLSALGSSAARSPLRAETQGGLEAGLDLVLRNRLTTRAVRFDQRATGLLQSVAVDADLGAPGPEQRRRISYELQNVGEIENRGWELQAAYAWGRLSVDGALSFVASRVVQVDRAYTGDLRVGDRPLEVPSRTVGVAATWRASRWSATAGLSAASDWIAYDRIALSEAFASAGRPSRDLLGSGLRQYWRSYGGAPRVQATYSRQLADRLSLTLSGKNLLDRQRGEPDNVTIVPGRTLSLGVAARW
jgi:iron complex outermembrane receptor protein